MSLGKDGVEEDEWKNIVYLSSGATTWLLQYLKFSHGRMMFLTPVRWLLAREEEVYISIMNSLILLDLPVIARKMQFSKTTSGHLEITLGQPRLTNHDLGRPVFFLGDLWPPEMITCWSSRMICVILGSLWMIYCFLGEFSTLKITCQHLRPPKISCNSQVIRATSYKQDNQLKYNQRFSRGHWCNIWPYWPHLSPG